MDERFVIIRLLEMDEEFERMVGKADDPFLRYVLEKRRQLAEMHNWPESGVFASHRHAYVFDLFEQVAVVRHKHGHDIRESIDRFIINPIGGFVAIVGLLFFMFFASFKMGDFISGLIEAPLDALGQRLTGMTGGLTAVAVSGLYDGLVSGVGIVLPYLVPLLILLAILEDSGLLPRIAFMVDGILHRFGLHGKSAVPIILGYGCNVPAIMAARGLEYERDRVLTMLIIPFIACSARTVIILALAGKYLGPVYTTAIYAGNILVALMVSFALSRLQVDMSPGIIMDVPPLRRPYPGLVASKVWWRLREFLTFAWPVIVVSSLALAFISHVGLDKPVNALLAPDHLGHPEAPGPDRHHLVPRHLPQGAHAPHAEPGPRYCRCLDHPVARTDTRTRGLHRALHPLCGHHFHALERGGMEGRPVFHCTEHDRGPRGRRRHSPYDNLAVERPSSLRIDIRISL